MKINTKDLSGLALEYITSMTAGYHPVICKKDDGHTVIEVECRTAPTELNPRGMASYTPLNDPASVVDFLVEYGLSILKLDHTFRDDREEPWVAFEFPSDDDGVSGSTPQEAVCRFVCFKRFGSVVDVPPHLS